MKKVNGGNGIDFRFGWRIGEQIGIQEDFFYFIFSFGVFEGLREVQVVCTEGWEVEIELIFGYIEIEKVIEYVVDQ